MVSIYYVEISFYFVKWAPVSHCCVVCLRVYFIRVFALKYVIAINCVFYFLSPCMNAFHLLTSVSMGFHSLFRYYVWHYLLLPSHLSHTFYIIHHTILWIAAKNYLLCILFIKTTHQTLISICIIIRWIQCHIWSRCCLRWILQRSSYLFTVIGTCMSL